MTNPTTEPLTDSSMTAADTSLSTTSSAEREEVSKDMARFSRRDRVKRAWDELSEADREALLNAARERRIQQAERDARMMDAYTHRYGK